MAISGILIATLGRYVVQTQHVRSGNIRLHRGLGIAAALIMMPFHAIEPMIARSAREGGPKLKAPLEGHKASGAGNFHCASSAINMGARLSPEVGRGWRQADLGTRDVGEGPHARLIRCVFTSLDATSSEISAE